MGQAPLLCNFRPKPESASSNSFCSRERVAPRDDVNAHRRTVTKDREQISFAKFPNLAIRANCHLQDYEFDNNVHLWQKTYHH